MALTSSSLSKEHEAYVRNNIDVKTDKELSADIGVSINKLRTNLRLLNIFRSEDRPRKHTLKVTPGYFSIEQWAKEFIY